MDEAAIQQYLEDNGYPAHVVEAGAAGLVRRFRDFVAEVEAGYAYGLHDYRNDLDIRGLIGLFGLDSEVADEDQRLNAMLIGRDHRIWESGAGDAYWDFGYPRNAGRWLMRDLRTAGLAGDDE
ncbi:MAG TPA: hypothetical protein VGL53_04805 [Bryobacteraceae bacterium]